jgi:hypothetical protein
LSQTGPIPHCPPDKFAAVDANPQNLPLSPQNLPLSPLAPVPPRHLDAAWLHSGSGNHRKKTIKASGGCQSPGNDPASALPVGRRMPVRERLGVCHRERVP